MPAYSTIELKKDSTIYFMMDVFLLKFSRCSRCINVHHMYSVDECYILDNSQVYRIRVVLQHMTAPIYFELYFYLSFSHVERTYLRLDWVGTHIKVTIVVCSNIVRCGGKIDLNLLEGVCIGCGIQVIRMCLVVIHYSALLTIRRSVYW